MEIKWLSPFGVYEINDFISKIKSNFFTIQTFSFKQSIQNLDLIELTNITVDSELSELSVNPMENRAITTVINQILDVIADHPTYISPTVSLNNITQIVENGSNLSGTLNVTFTQNDAGQVISYSIWENLFLLPIFHVHPDASYSPEGVPKDKVLLSSLLVKIIPEPTSILVSDVFLTKSKSVIPSLNQYSIILLFSISPIVNPLSLVPWVAIRASFKEGQGPYLSLSKLDKGTTGFIPYGKFNDINL